MNEGYISNWQSIREGLFPVSVILLAFCLPWLKDGIQLPIAFSVLTWFAYPKKFSKKNFKLFLLFAGIYFFHLIGMIYTENVPRGMRDLEQKLSLILFPLLFAFAIPMAKQYKRYVLPAFVVGLFIGLIISFYTSFADFHVSGDPHKFYMSSFSVFHPSYLAMFMVWSVGILLWHLTFKEYQLWRRILFWILIFLLSVLLVFPASKMGFLSLGVTLVFFFILWIYKKKVEVVNSVLLLSVGLLTVGVMLYDPVSNARVQSAVSYMDESDPLNENRTKTESNAARGYAIGIALQEIKKYHIFGTGTGDINDVLMASFREDGLSELAAKELNPHNEFLQVALAQGLIAAFWFAYSLFYAARKGVKREDYMLVFFILLIFLNFMVESMLEKQTGVIFFAFFNAFLFFSHLESESSNG